MSECVSISSSGTLVDQGPATASSTGYTGCAGYVLVDAQTYASLDTAVQFMYSVPTAQQAIPWFVGTFSTVMLFYMVARACGSVANFFDGDGKS